MKTIILCFVFALICQTSMAKDYVIRFESGRRVVTIPCENARDKQNKLAQANKWAKGNPARKVKVAADNRNYIKLVGNAIVPLTQAEIDALQPPKDKTDKEKLLELLKDSDIKKEIRKIATP